ncbi:amino acid ABC transporter permease [Paenibacillus sepulcri]|uniref:Amino acid ABC transporter permease n=1 Tax=Paenibacillus sepulcri TaxID=359917 RepID=A0ABS7C1Z2_9BACL|nr:amino acid ABC transporter permease [Paenibacillus sepulcri]
MENFDLDYALKQFPDVLKAVPMTLLVATVSLLLGFVFGLLISLCRTYKVPVLSQLGALYVSFIRGTPMLVQIYVIFFGTPMLIDYLNKQFGWGLNPYGISPLVYALLAFTVNTSAYQSETIRSALQSTEAGQMEAALSIGMTVRQALFRIIAPQAFLIALPVYGNLFIGLIKGTSLAFAVKVIEIMATTRIIAGGDYRFLEMYIDAAIVYWVLCFLVERLFVLLEKRFSRHEKVMP